MATSPQDKGDEVGRLEGETELQTATNVVDLTLDPELERFGRNYLTAIGIPHRSTCGIRPHPSGPITVLVNSQLIVYLSVPEDNIFDRSPGLRFQRLLLSLYWGWCGANVLLKLIIRYH